MDDQVPADGFLPPTAPLPLTPPPVAQPTVTSVAPPTVGSAFGLPPLAAVPPMPPPAPPAGFVPADSGRVSARPAKAGRSRSRWRLAAALLTFALVGVAAVTIVLAQRLSSSRAEGRRLTAALAGETAALQTSRAETQTARDATKMAQAETDTTRSELAAAAAATDTAKTRSDNLQAMADHATARVATAEKERDAAETERDVARKERDIADCRVINLATSLLVVPEFRKSLTQPQVDQIQRGHVACVAAGYTGNVVDLPV